MLVYQRVKHVQKMMGPMNVNIRIIRHDVNIHEFIRYNDVNSHEISNHDSYHV